MIRKITYCLVDDTQLPLLFTLGAYDGNTEAQELYTQKIDKAMRALTRMEKELATTESAMAQMESATEQAAQELTQAESAVTDMGSAYAKAAREVDTAKTSTTGMSETAAAAQKSVEKLSGGFTVLKGTLSNLVADALRKGASLLKEFTRDSITMASDLEEVDNVVSTAFAGSEESIRQFADAAATQFGLSSLAAQSYAGKAYIKLCHCGVYRLQRQQRVGEVAGETVLHQYIKKRRQLICLRVGKSGHDKDTGSGLRTDAGAGFGMWPCPGLRSTCYWRRPRWPWNMPRPWWDGLMGRQS